MTRSRNLIARGERKGMHLRPHIGLQASTWHCLRPSPTQGSRLTTSVWKKSWKRSRRITRQGQYTLTSRLKQQTPVIGRWLSADLNRVTRKSRHCSRSGHRGESSCHQLRRSLPLMMKRKRKRAKVTATATATAPMIAITSLWKPP